MFYPQKKNYVGFFFLIINVHIRWLYGQAMCAEYVEEKRDLVRAIPKDRKLVNLPKISQVQNCFSFSCFSLISPTQLMS